jgi:uncharacterized protein YggT (Ycf19 family)
MIGALIAWVAYGLTGLLFLMAVMCLLLALLHWLPGSFGNSLRRLTFSVCRPWLSLGTRWALFRVGRIDLAALTAALVFVLLGRFLMPWMVLWGYSIRG